MNDEIPPADFGDVPPLVEDETLTAISAASEAIVIPVKEQLVAPDPVIKGPSKSPESMLLRSSDDPLEQSRLLTKYLSNKDKQKRILVEMCSKRTIQLLQEFDPQVLEGLID